MRRIRGPKTDRKRLARSFWSIKYLLKDDQALSVKCKFMVYTSSCHLWCSDLVIDKSLEVRTWGLPATYGAQYTWWILMGCIAIHHVVLTKERCRINSEGGQVDLVMDRSRLPHAKWVVGQDDHGLAASQLRMRDSADLEGNVCDLDFFLKDKPDAVQYWDQLKKNGEAFAHQQYPAVVSHRLIIIINFIFYQFYKHMW